MVKIMAVGHLHCHHCSKVFKVMDKIKSKFPDVEIEKIDITRHPHMALRHKLLYCPSIVIDDKYIFHGIPSEHKLFTKIESVYR